MTLWEDAVEYGNQWVADFIAYPPHAWLNDPREPLFTFEWRGQPFGFYAMSMTFWSEVLFFMAFEGILAAIFSQLVYHYIIPNKNTTKAYLIGYGFIIPFWLAFPATIINLLDAKNKLFRFTLAAVTPSLCTFRTTEAMHGFTPEHALQSANAFMIYFGLPMVAKYDKHMKEYVKATPAHIRMRFFEVLRSYAYTGTVYSMYLMYPELFPTMGVIENPNYFSLSHILTRKNLRNACYHLLIFEATLATSGNGGNFVSTLLTGYEMEPFMRNPLFESNTCAEFWNKRWNKLIQTLMSRGVFKPFRTILPIYPAMAATFAVSGLFHEWLMSLIFAPLPEELDENGNCIPPDCFKLTHGSAVIFFSWIAMEISLEFMFVPKRYFRNPYIWYKVASSAFAALASVFFLDPYVHTRFFNEGYVGYFMVHPVSDWV